MYESRIHIRWTLNKENTFLYEMLDEYYKREPSKGYKPHTTGISIRTDILSVIEN